jgi:3-hydroxyacyl-[acyl-carrier-protein] dehydratase
MRFSLIDRVVELDPGRKITALKSLALAEEYLADHFPSAPVMPGVLMLESLVQSSAWLVRASENFAHSLVLLKQARGVKYSNFVEPGQTLRITAEIMDQDQDEVRVKAHGSVDGRLAVSARLDLQRFNLAEQNPDHAGADMFAIAQLRHLWSLLYKPDSPPAEAS